MSREVTLDQLFLYQAGYYIDMDEKIKKLQKDTKKLAKEESSLLREDKKHDRLIEKSKKKMRKKC